MPCPRHPPFPSAELIAILFALAVTAAAIGLTAWLGERWAIWWDARDWTRARCVVVQLPGETTGLAYAYEMAGSRHVATTIAIGEANAMSIVPSGTAVGSTIACWVNPRDPTRALLSRDFAAGWLLPGAWVLAAALLLGALRGAGAIGRWLWSRPDPSCSWRAWRQSLYRHGAWKLTVPGAALVGLGIALTWAVGILPLWNWWRAQQWTESTCVIVAGDVRWSAPSKVPLRGRYVMDLAFAYQAQGQQHVATTYSPWRAGAIDWLMPPPREMSKGRVVELTTAFALGTTHHCYVAPHDPARAYIDRRWWNGWYGIGPIGPMILVLGALLVMARPRR